MKVLVPVSILLSGLVAQATMDQFRDAPLLVGVACLVIWLGRFINQRIRKLESLLHAALKNSAELEQRLVEALRHNQREKPESKE